MLWHRSDSQERLQSFVAILRSPASCRDCWETPSLRLLLQEDLIGHEKERKGDERRRAEAHAQWLAQQDEADVKRLMDGMKNGFRQPRRPGFLLEEVFSPSQDYVPI